MGYSGLIYAAIVAAWAAFLVPRWVRRNEEVERARETDAARGVRVLQRRSGPAHAPHAPIELPAELHSSLVTPASSAASGAPSALSASAATAASPGLAASAAAADPDSVSMGPSARDLQLALREARLAFAEAAARRRRILTALVGVVAACVVGAVFRLVPWFVPAAVAVVLVGFLIAARRAAVAQGRRERSLMQRAAAAPVVAEDEVVDDGSARRLVIPDEAAPEPVDPDSWVPVPVPLPTYVTKAAAAPRPTRTINLSAPGSWTSGRLDPAASIELPRRDPISPPSTAPAARAEADTTSSELPEHRRAVGD